MTGRKIMEEMKVFMNSMTTMLETLSLTLKQRCQRDCSLNVSENDLVQKGRHELSYTEDTLNMEVAHKELIRGNYSAFSRASGLLKFVW